MEWWLPRTRTPEQPGCPRKRTMSLPFGRGSLFMGELGEVPIQFPDCRWGADPRQSVFNAKRIDVAAKRLAKIRDRFLLGCSFAVRGDVWNTRRVAAKF